MRNDTFDVAILGSGIGGSMLACILAKAGASVLLLEELAHPRFAIGESLIPETGVRLRILAEKYGVPEIGWLGNFHSLRDNVSSACGVKRSFSFVYHRPGEPARADELTQLPTLTPPFGPDSHLFRQDTDAWLAATAVRYGAVLRQQTKIERIAFHADGVVLEGKGETFRARFLLDAGGMRSLPATLLGLRDAVPRFRTDTRALYTHFVGIKPADFLFARGVGRGHDLPSPLGQATLHHVFSGGWMWIIPFNNHREATNPLCSVGVMLDRRRHPTPRGAPAEEFRSIVARYPTIARHFAEAREVRPWTGTGRLQYSSRHHVAPRLLQLPHAAAFVDPLFSSGMSVLTVAIDLIAEILLGALGDGDFDVERFRPVEDVVNDGFDHYDPIVSRAFDAFADRALWNAWNRTWVMGNFLGTFGPMALLVRYLATGDRSFLAKTTERARIGVLSSHLPEVRAIMAASAADVDAATEGRMSTADASARIFARLRAAEFLPPHMGFGDPARQAPGTFTLAHGARNVLWYRRQPPRWREYVDFPLATYARLALEFAAGGIADGSRRGWATLRDVLFAGNDEWRHAPAAYSGSGEWVPGDDAAFLDAAAEVA